MKTFLKTVLILLCIMQVSFLTARYLGYVPTKSTAAWVMAWVYTLVTFGATVFTFVTLRDKNSFTKFCWLPTELSVYVPNACRGRTGKWEKSGKKAWLRTVWVKRTHWNDVYYVEKT